MPRSYSLAPPADAPLTAEPGAPARRARNHAAAVVAVAALAIACLVYPIITNAIPPLADYGGHLSRIFILYNLIHGTGFADMYRIHLAVVPNLAVDGIILGLMELGVPVELAGRCFVAIMLVVLGGGIIAFHYAAFRRISIWPLLALPFIYQDLLFWGFLNYLLGVGLAMATVALWRVNAQDNLARAAITLFGCCLILFFCHLFALLLAFGLVVGIELSRILLPRYRRKRYPFAPSAIAIVAAGAPLALLLFAPLLGKTHPAFTDILPQLTFASLMLRLKELLWFSRAYNPTVDLISLAVVLGLGAYGLTRGLLRFDIPALLPIGGLIVTYLIVPDGWFGTHYLPDRLPQVIFFLGVAATDVVVKKSWERTSLFLIVAVLAVTRGAVAQQAWRSANARFAPVIAAFSNIPEGSRIYTAIAHKGDSSLNRRLPYSQLAGYATIYRHAFCLDTYADPSQNVVLRQPVYETAPRTPRNYQADGPQDPDDPYDPARLAFYDFALVIGPTLWPQTPPQSLKPVVAEPDYTLFRIEHPDRR